MSKSYGADNIQVLEDIEHLRLRPSMYIGSQDSDGVRHILKEIFDNGIDEYLAGHATSVEVEIDTKTHVFRVLDNGRGIPIEKHKKTGESTLITVFTNLQAGGKFDKQSYAVSAGLHGVGLKATNALSEWLLARVWRAGYCWEQRFARGVAQTKAPTPNKALNARGRTGTEVLFLPDTEIFGQHRIDIPRVRQWMEETSHLCPGLKVRLVVDGQESLFESSGLGSLVLTRSASASALHTPISFENKERTISLSLLWTEEEGENWFSACNASSTPEGGKHVDGAMSAIADVLGPYAAKKSLDAKDLSDGLYAAIQVLVPEPKFKSQTKDRLLNPEVKDSVYAFVYPQLKAYFDQNKKLAEKIVARAIQIKKARESYKKLRNVLNQTGAKKDARGILPDKLVEAMHCAPKDRELYLVEGDSASGSAKIARNPDYQEVLPLKGKIPNAVQTPPDKLFQNTEISSILTATGVQLGPKGKGVDLSNVRVGKVILLMDADEDGCFTGDTRVKLLNGTTPTFEELHTNWSQTKEDFWVYSLDATGLPVPGKASNVRITKQVTELVEVTLDSGESFRCTPDHRVVTRCLPSDDRVCVDDSGLPYVRAENLKEGDSLYHLPLRMFGERPAFIAGPFVHQWVFANTHPEDEVQAYSNKKSKNELHIHHIDENVLNNSPENLELKRGIDHIRDHGVFAAYNRTEDHSKVISDHWKSGTYAHRDTFKSYNGSSKHKKDLSAAWARGVYDPHQQLLSREAGYYASLVLAGYPVSSATWKKYRVTGVRSWEGVPEGEWDLIQEMLPSWKGREYAIKERTKAEYPTQMVAKFVRVCKQVLAENLDLTESNYEAVRKQKIREGFDRACKWCTAVPKMGLAKEDVLDFVKTCNHKVVFVSKIQLTTPVNVYDMEVANHHNFALSSDVVVHNSHIASLALTLFCTWMPEFVKDGYLYIVDSPLFVGVYKEQRWYAHTLQELETLSGYPIGKIQVSRLKGHGECLDGSSLVFTDRGTLPISSLCPTTPGVSTPKLPILVPSRSSPFSSLSASFFKESAAVSKVKTRFGYNLVSTLAHEYLTLEEGIVTWKKLSDMEIGDYVALDRREPGFSIPAPSLSAPFPVVRHILPETLECMECEREFKDLRSHLHTKHLISWGEYSAKYPAAILFSASSACTSAPLYKLPEEVTPELARLLGYLIGDGSCTTKSMTIHHGLDREAAEDSNTCLTKSFPGLPVRTYSYLSDNNQLCWNTTFCSTYVSSFLWESCGLPKTTAHHKYVPDCIMRSPNSLVAEFLRGYFDSDGWSEVHSSPKVGYYTASERLSEDIRVLLLRFGIVCKGHYQPLPFSSNFADADTEGAKIYLEGVNVDLFFDKIGFVAPRKKSREQVRTSRNTNVDVIPGMKEAILKVRDAHRQGRPGCSRYKISDGSVVRLSFGCFTAAEELTYQYLDVGSNYKNMLDALLLLSSPLAESLKWLFENRPFWDPIISVEEAGTRPVYDLTVPEGESYTANGIMVHNSSSEELKHYAMDPSTRKLWKISLGADDTDIILSLMGSDSAARKTLLGLL